MATRLEPRCTVCGKMVAQDLNKGFELAGRCSAIALIGSYKLFVTQIGKDWVQQAPSDIQVKVLSYSQLSPTLHC